MLKKKIEDQKNKKPTNNDIDAGTGIGITRKRTPVQLKEVTEANLSTTIVAPLKKAVKPIVKAVASTGGLPESGYHIISRNEPEKLELLRQHIIKGGICALDYETDGDPDDEAQDPQDHHLTMVSFAYKVGQAFCMPLAMDSYGANWNLDEFIKDFMKPIMEDPNILLVIHNVRHN